MYFFKISNYLYFLAKISFEAHLFYLLIFKDSLHSEAQLTFLMGFKTSYQLSMYY